jgi:hypothetical protein
LGPLEWSHEVNAPHIKYFYLKVIVEGHCVASGDASLKLALLAPLDELLGVLVHCWPEESTLPDFGLCAKYSIVASVRSRVTFFNNPHSFCRRYTPPQ